MSRHTFTHNPGGVNSQPEISHLAPNDPAHTDPAHTDPDRAPALTGDTAVPSTTDMPARANGTSSSGVRNATVRQQNLATVLRLLHLDGPLSRSAIVQHTGLTRTAVGTLATDLVELGMVEERDPPPKGARGRPSPVVHPLAEQNIVVGLDLMVDSIGAVVSGLGGSVLRSERRDRGRASNDPEASVSDALTLVDRMTGDLRPSRRLGIGVAVPGLVAEPSQQLVLAPNLGWSDVDIAGLVRDRIGAETLVTVANEADLGAVAESRRGDVAGTGHVLFVSGEVGVGGGVISDGRLVTGTNGFAGEIGHIPVNPTGERCSCGAIGCFETELGEAALLRRVGYDGSGRAEVDRLIAHAEAGDASVAAALDEHARWLAFGLSGPLNLLDLDLVVLGGLLGRIFPHIETALERELADRALIANRTTPVVAASLGEDAAAIGAAEFTWDRIIAGVGMRLGTAN